MQAQPVEVKGAAPASFFWPVSHEIAYNHIVRASLNLPKIDPATTES